MSDCAHCKTDRSECKCCCGEECTWLDEPYAPGGQCEGPVEAVGEWECGDGEFMWIHMCAKHAKNYWESVR